MAILAFQKPDKVLMLEADSRFGKFEFRPLEPGFGITVGNALRRILLSSLEGFAITTIKIDGVEHEFSSVPGAKEDVTNIILNLKQVRFKQVVEEFESEKVSITVENSSEFKAGDIGKYLTGFEVLNPELVICHLDSKSTMQIDITINKGRGYVPADENREYCTDVNVIPIDSIYTPIRNVKYQVENFRVEQKTDYEKLVLEITTDGSIHPKEALKEAAKILIYHFMLFSDEKITLETNDVDGNEEFDEEVLHMRQLLKTKLVDMDLSVRALNCLKAADVETLGDLVQFMPEATADPVLPPGSFGRSGNLSVSYCLLRQKDRSDLPAVCAGSPVSVLFYHNQTISYTSFPVFSQNHGKSDLL